MGKKFSHLNYQKRKILSTMIKQGFHKQDIADALGISQSTVYRELERGLCDITKTDLSVVREYSPDLAECKYQENLRAKGKKTKVEKDDKLNKYLAYMILYQHFSPTAIIYDMRANNLRFDEEIKACNTIYNAVKKGLIKGVSEKNLYYQGKRKKVKRKQDRTHKKEIAGTSIELRDPEILKREEFGHWEMDSVIGQQTNKKTLLVLTERKTRYEVILMTKNHNADETRKALNRVEKKYKSGCFSVFKTITVDNGSEFADCKAMEKALYRVGNRTKVYYCHPHSPHERGSNENCNLLVRRFFPKGSDFDSTLNKAKVKEAEDWINTYPRSLHNGKCSEELFIEELRKIGIDFYKLE